MDTIVKQVNFGVEARETVMTGVEKLAKAVMSTLGASGKCVLYPLVALYQTVAQQLALIK